MRFLDLLIPPGSVAAGLVTLSMAVAIGLAIGSIPLLRIKLGVSGVLFSALLFGQLGISVTGPVLDFLRDFSLILFIYAVGLQVGPGFVESLKAEGLRLNVLSIIVLVLGGVMTLGVVRAGHLEHSSTSGLYSGAFTTTPGLAAGQEVIRRVFSPDSDASVRAAGLAYAVTYPFGIVGPLLTIVMLRRMFSIDVNAERLAHAAAAEARRPNATTADIEVTNPDLAGTALKDLEFARKAGIVFGRILRDGAQSVPHADTVIRIGDVFRAIGLKTDLDNLVPLLGRKSEIDLSTVASGVQRVELIVTRTRVLRKSLRELDLTKRFGVTLARVVRAGINVVPTASLKLQFGDTVVALGTPESLKLAEHELGNCPDVLNRPQLIPMFIGIALGILTGCIPFFGLKLGLAAGPLLVAIILSRLGNIGSFVWYMPAAANQLFREFGLAVFLACVGLQQGDHFVQNLLSGNGIELLVLGAALCVVPPLLVGMFARAVYKTNFITLSGWIAGAMTSSPALMYASDITGSEAPALAYAAVAPLAMIVPIIVCQLLAAMK